MVSEENILYESNEFQGLNLIENKNLSNKMETLNTKQEKDSNDSNIKISKINSIKANNKLSPIIEFLAKEGKANALDKSMNNGKN